MKNRQENSSQMLAAKAKDYERETKINEKQFLVSLFFNQDGLDLKHKVDESPYRSLVEASDSILHVPGIMDDWKEDIIRQRYDQRIAFLKLLTEQLVPAFYSHQLNFCLSRQYNVDLSIQRVTSYLETQCRCLPYDPVQLRSTLDL